MLPSPWSLGFVLGTVAGALLVPGCRPQDGSSGLSESEIRSSTVHFQSGYSRPHGGVEGARDKDRSGWEK